MKYEKVELISPPGSSKSKPPVPVKLSPAAQATLKVVKEQTKRRAHRRTPGFTVRHYDNTFVGYDWLLPGWVAEERFVPTGRQGTGRTYKGLFVMRRYSPQYYSPPRRGYGGRERSPLRRGYSGGGGGGGGGYGRRREQNNGSLLVRNIPLDCRPEELRIPFERFGLVRDVYIPKDYYTGAPRGFAFVQFVDAYDAAEAQWRMNGKIFGGREISVVVAAENRKRPEDMRHKARLKGPSSYGGRSSYHGRSRSRSISPMRSPHRPSGSRARYHSRSYSPVPRRRGNYSVSPDRRHGDHPRSLRGPPQVRDGDYSRRSYSPGYENAGRNGYSKKPAYESEEAIRAAQMPSPPGRASRSPPGSRSRSADPSPRRS
ncbi:hypothetical protein V6N13_062698 [Hibiscus sabdariffa]|uniref:RRM domain-containing protein n=2 Tax=Hibiscus sabdariffa TaxID=183260 RepID=A0ABR2A2I7_9ROSI